MPDLRFPVGTTVMCNLGPRGWRLGTVIAQYYREDNWLEDQVAPYQVVLEAEHALIYVPVDNDQYCRKATDDEVRSSRRMDALAEGGPGVAEGDMDTAVPAAGQLGCQGAADPGGSSYRSGRCGCCDCCPRHWSSVELYSRHYLCAARNGLAVTQHVVDLGTVRLGEAVQQQLGEDAPVREGYMQCPTLVRLPPGLRFADDGSLVGEVGFDPYRADSYQVAFVAVSTVDWENPEVGLVRLEINFTVEGNDPPATFDVNAFVQEQHQAHSTAQRYMGSLSDCWQRWESKQVGNQQTCDEMLALLGQLRELLEQHPRLDRGQWWAQLGGYHMNVHKLLENALFECELYLGHALTFEDAGVRWMAEQNLEGCYQKRLLEAARFMWIDGCEQMMQKDWAAAAETLRQAAAQKDGWGWAVNFGDIWFTEAAARLAQGAQLAAEAQGQVEEGASEAEAEEEAKAKGEAAEWIAEAKQVLERGLERTEGTKAWGPDGHPWGAELRAALSSYQELQASGADTAEWVEAFTSRTISWCGQVLGGAGPFPPKPRPRREDARELVKRMPGHNS